MTGVDDVVREHMRAAGCEQGTDRYCRPHGLSNWDAARDECSVIGSAVRAGYRAAIEDAEIHARVSAYHYEGPLALAWCNAASSIRSLLPTTTEQDKSDD